MSTSNPVQLAIISRLQSFFSLEHLEVLNESYMHSVPPGSESHFKVIVVSNDFCDMRLIGRHRLINQALADELKNHIHALAIHTYTVDEWQEVQSAPSSPQCMGGR
jgi:BolA protein